MRSFRRSLPREGLLSSDEQGNVLDGVAAVAEAVPVRPLGLRTPGQIGCAGPERCFAWAVSPCQQFPPPPAVTVALADEPGVLPRAAADADLYLVDGRRARPRHSPHDQVAGGDLLAGGWLGDDRADLLQAHRFARHG